MKKEDVQNKKLAADALAEKYGDIRVGVIKLTDEYKEALQNADGGMLPPSALVTKRLPGVLTIPLAEAIDNDMMYMKRCEAELDEAYLQPVMYVVATYAEPNAEDKIFCMHRIGKLGDARLSGLYSIGVGGHVDEGEKLLDCFYRELQEEVGVTRDDISSTKCMGYIYDRSTAIGRVHLGVVYAIRLKHGDIAVAEPDKLRGEWITKEHLAQLRVHDQMETWSNICADMILEKNPNEV